MGNAVHAAFVEPIEGRTVLVTGCGPIGLCAVGHRQGGRRGAGDRHRHRGRTGSSWPARWAPTSRSTRAIRTPSSGILRRDRRRRGGGRARDERRAGRARPGAARRHPRAGGSACSASSASRCAVDLSDLVIQKGLRAPRHLRPPHLRHLGADPGAAALRARSTWRRSSPIGSTSPTGSRPSTCSPRGTPERWCSCHDRYGVSAAAPRNPLAFLDAEIDELRAKGLYRRLRVVRERAGSRCVIDGREVITLSSNNYLGLNTHPRLREAAIEAIEALRRRVGGGAHHRRHDEPPRGAGGAAGRRSSTSRRCSPSSPASPPTPASSRSWPPEGAVIVSRRAEPRQHHRRHPADQGRAQGLPARRHRRAARDPARDARRARRRRSDRSWSSPMASSAWTATSRACRRSSRRPRRPMRSSTSTTRTRPGVLGRNGRGTRRPLRPPRPGARPGRDPVQGDRRARRLRGRAASRCARCSIHRARPFLFSTSHPPAVAAACLAAIDVLETEPELIERLWAQHPPLQGRPGAPRLRHRRSRRHRSPRSSPARGAGHAAVGSAVRGGRVRAWGSASRRCPEDQEPGADHRHRRAHREELDTCLAAFEKVGRELALI